MRYRRRTLDVAVVAIVVCASCSVAEDTGFVLQVSSSQNSIKLGDPVAFEVAFKYEKALTLPGHGTGPIDSLAHATYLDIIHKNETFSKTGIPLFPADMKRMDEKGLVYGGGFMILYDVQKKRFIFPEPGDYEVSVRSRGKTSNTLRVTVRESSAKNMKAMAALAPEDYAFLEHGEVGSTEERSERISSLESFVSTADDTPLSKLAKGRLGIELMDHSEKEYAGVLSGTQKQNPLPKGLQKASGLLADAYSMPDEYPIREDVLCQLARVETVRGDFEKAFSLVDELVAKYPRGEFGSRAEAFMDEIRSVRERGVIKPLVRGRSHPWSHFIVWIVIVGAIVAAIVWGIYRSRWQPRA